MLSTSLCRPELLAPAGDRECLRAAVENGADAVYFGLNCGFNARARATNIERNELGDVMAFLHHRGVKGYVTLNTLVFPSELRELEDLVRQIARDDVDAVLVQDIGLLRLIRLTCPDLPIHASTQMTLTSAECIRVAAELGIQRVVLPRELSLREIAKLRRSCAVPLEAFVHGALCVAYSGQCLTSESLGGRSANRGQCAQACRLPYDLICDGEDIDLGTQKYLLSPQDLAAYDLTTDLIAAGVSSFKIEGRLKTPEYVANITKHYRAAIDAAMTGMPREFTAAEVREMELSFSRGFSPGWLRGDDHKMLVPGQSSAKRGILLGEIVRIGQNFVEVQLAGPVARGDGIVFEGDRAAGEEQGGRVFGISRRDRPIDAATDGVVALEFAGLHRDRGIEFVRLAIGQKLWKTDDPRLTAKLRQTFTGPDPLRKRPLDVKVRCLVGQPLQLIGTLPSLVSMASTDPTEECGCEPFETGLISVVITSPEPLPVARKHPITVEFLREQLSRLGNTVYELKGLETEIIGSPMIPLSVLSQLRRQLVARLDEATRQPRPRNLFHGAALTALRASIGREEEPFPVPEADAAANAEVSRTRDRHEPPSSIVAPRLHVLCRTLEQLRVVAQNSNHEGLVEEPRLELPARSDSGDWCTAIIYADFQDIRQYREAVAIARRENRIIYLATPRIQKPDEAGLIRAMMKYSADGMLVRNLSGMRFCAEHSVPFVGDYTLNATNELTSQFLISEGSQRITASYDLNRDQLVELVTAAPPCWFEIVVHQHMPMFHMEHCVFCAVLSPGTNKHNCGRPCDTMQVQLRDRVGSEHPLKADVACRNTLFNAVPQSGADVVGTLLEQGIRDFRVECLEESPTAVRQILGLYRNLLAGRIRSEDVWRTLHAANRVGVTRGTLEQRRNPLAIL